jgi:hypothetical protein
MEVTALLFRGNSSSNSTKNVEPLPLRPPRYVQNTAHEIRENRGILGHVVLKLALQMMEGFSSTFFNVSFYVFTHNNYSIFTLLFKLLLFSE